MQFVGRFKCKGLCTNCPFHSCFMFFQCSKPSCQGYFVFILLEQIYQYPKITEFELKPAEVMVASVGAFTTLTTVSYLFRVQNRTWYFTMLVQCGLGLGVSTIWALHFVGMRAIKLIGVDSSDIKFDSGLTLLSAVSPWMFSTFAIHVLKSERSKLRILVAAILLTIGIASMHYTGVVAERGLFNPTIDAGMILKTLVEFKSAMELRNLYGRQPSFTCFATDFNENSSLASQDKPCQFNILNPNN